LLGPIREVALSFLDEAAERAAAAQAHAATFAALADDLRTELNGPGGAAAMPRVEIDLPHFHSALRWFAERNDAERALIVVGGLWRFWYLRGRYQEGIAALQLALSTPGVASEQRRAIALNGLGAHLAAISRTEEAIDAYARAIDLWQTAGDDRGRAGTLNNRGLLLSETGRYHQAISQFEEALTIFTALGDEWRAAAVLDNIGFTLTPMGEHARAIDAHSKALVTRRSLGDANGIAISLHNLSVAFNRDGRHAEAKQLASEALTIRRERGDRSGVAGALVSLGNVEQALNDFDAARAHFQEALDLYRELGQPREISLALYNLGSCAEQRGDLQACLPLLRESLTLRRQHGGPRDLGFSLQAFAGLALENRQFEHATLLLASAVEIATTAGAVLPNRDEAIDTLRRRLGRARFDALWEEGRTSSIDQAIALTEQIVWGERPPVAIQPANLPSAPSADHDLTPRELDVLRLVATGKTNADIGAALFISPFTAKTHVANLLGKLGVESRAAASTWAAQHGLL
jgi:tetratricopeptide (TPR) repeat protein/DNA-binding CsgD family transcriptional regulator